MKAKDWGSMLLVLGERDSSCRHLYDAYLVIHVELKRGTGKKNSIFIGWFN